MNSNDYSHCVNDFIRKLRLEKFDNEQEKAEKTLECLEHVISILNISSARDLLDASNALGTEIQSKMPWETTPHNMVQRVKKIIKDEYNALKPVEAGSNSFQNFAQSKMIDVPSDERWNKVADVRLLKNNILEALLEQKAEIEQCQEMIAIEGESKIHSDEIILTCGFCPTVLAFLLRASKKRRFHTIVAECAPKYDGHRMAKSLSAANIQTTIIQDCAIFSMMSRVNKVIIGCQTVLCNGGIKTFLGAASLALAAKYYSVPLYVCTPTYKFSSELTEEINDFDDPSPLIPKGLICNLSNVNFAIAKFDYVPPKNIASFITNNRGIAPSYVYRQVMELYHPSAEDI